MSLDEYDYPSQKAFWCEWNHPNESSRSLVAITSGLIENNWHKLIRPGATCIDVGAHSGDTAIPMGIFCADFRRNIRGHVYAIEPNPEVFPVLEITLNLNNHICKFTPLQIAIIKEASGEVTLSDHGNGNCNGGIIDINFASDLREKLSNIQKITFTVQGVNLESLYKNYMTVSDQRNLSFIKIDCEGYDKEILRSSASFLKGIRPTIFVEWFDMFSAEDSNDLFNAIEEIGYNAFEGHTFERASVNKKVNDLILIPHN
jgi:FkbM family methyltransferase